MNYALIENGIVINVIWLDPDNAGDFPSAARCDVPAKIGDAYQDGRFYRDGSEVLTLEEDYRRQLEDALEALRTLGYTGG